MSLILQPQAAFTVVRQLANHLDTDTYYVRAVIRNAYNDEIIETLDLTDRGGQRFSQNWQVAPDVSGFGFYVSIVTSVYTDAGYTTKSENYGDEENTYLVQDRIKPQRGGGGGGVDSRTIRKILREELEAMKEAETKDSAETETEDAETEDDAMPFAEILARLDAIKEGVSRPFPEQKDVDFAPLLKSLDAVKQSIVDKEVTPQTDLEPVLEAIRALSDKFDSTIDALAQSLDMSQEQSTGDLNDIKESIPKLVEEVLKKATFNIAATEATMTMPKQKEPVPSPINIKDIAS